MIVWSTLFFYSHYLLAPAKEAFTAAENAAELALGKAQCRPD